MHERKMLKMPRRILKDLKDQIIVYAVYLKEFKIRYNTKLHLADLNNTSLSARIHKVCGLY